MKYLIVLFIILLLAGCSNAPETKYPWDNEGYQYTKADSIKMGVY